MYEKKWKYATLSLFMYFTYNCAAILHSYHSSSRLKSFFLFITIMISKTDKKSLIWLCSRFTIISRVICYIILWLHIISKMGIEGNLQPYKFMLIIQLSNWLQYGQHLLGKWRWKTCLYLNHSIKVFNGANVVLLQCS